MHTVYKMTATTNGSVTVMSSEGRKGPKSCLSIASWNQITIKKMNTTVEFDKLFTNSSDWIPPLQPVMENQIPLQPFLENQMSFQPVMENHVHNQKLYAPPPYPGNVTVGSPEVPPFHTEQALSPPPLPSPSPGLYSSVSTCSTPLPQHCTSPVPSVFSEAETIPELPELKLDINLVDLDLSESIMASEATGSKMPLIKNDLKYKIQKRRRESGLDELKVSYKEPEPEVLTDKDRERRERRRASNRKAAMKCRIKKKDAAKQQEKEKEQLEAENQSLREQVAKLQRQRDCYIELLKKHQLNDKCLLR